MNKHFLNDMGNLKPRKKGTGKRGTISPEQFVAWRKSQGLTLTAAAEKLGVSFNTASAYEGKAKIEARGAGVQTGLAMAAIAAGLSPWSEDSEAELTALRSVLDALRKGVEK